MRIPNSAKFHCFVIVSLFAASLVPSRADAQSVWDRIKQQAQKSQQQQQQQGQTQQPPDRQSSTRSATAAAPVDADAEAAAPAPSGDCCSAEAMKKIGGSLGFVDIVGIKLGMTPEQAVAAIKAYNPNFKIEVLTARLEHPSGPLGNFVRVKYSINSYTVNHSTLNGPVEWIALEFSTPPNPPLVAKIARYVGFPVGQPVIASNLLASLRKKYGQDNFDGGAYRAWVYDSNGKLLTRMLTSPEKLCVGDSQSSGVPGGAAGEHQGGESGVSIDLDSTKDGRDPERAPGCTSLVFATASNVGSGNAPNSQQIQMTVMLESGALMYNSMKATHDWLQAELDAKTKQQNDAAKQRTGPQL